MLNDFLNTLDCNLSQLHQSLKERDEVTARRLLELEQNSKEQQEYMQFLNEALNAKRSLPSSAAGNLHIRDEEKEENGEKEERAGEERGTPEDKRGQEERVMMEIRGGCDSFVIAQYLPYRSNS